MTINLTLNDLTTHQLQGITDVMSGKYNAGDGVVTVTGDVEISGDVTLENYRAVIHATTDGFESEDAAVTTAPLEAGDKVVITGTTQHDGDYEVVATTVELDKNGLPWDARIHGQDKKKNADGTWKFIRGIDRDTIVPEVEAELRQALAAVPSEASTDSSAAAGPDTAPSPPSAGPTTFQELLPLVTAAKNEGRLTDAKLEEVCKELGLPKFGLIATREDLIPQAAELLGV